jgi:hypothetical protein
MFRFDRGNFLDDPFEGIDCRLLLCAQCAVRPKMVKEDNQGLLHPTNLSTVTGHVIENVSLYRGI